MPLHPVPAALFCDPDWNAAYDQYEKGSLRRQAANMLDRNSADVEDALQDTRLQVIKSIHLVKFNCEEDVKAWLRTVNENKCKDILRRKKRSPRSNHSFNEDEIEASEFAIPSNEPASGTSKEIEYLNEVADKELKRLSQEVAFYENADEMSRPMMKDQVIRTFIIKLGTTLDELINWITGTNSEDLFPGFGDGYGDPRDPPFERAEKLRTAVDRKPDHPQSPQTPVCAENRDIPLRSENHDYAISHEECQRRLTEEGWRPRPGEIVFYCNSYQDKTARGMARNHHTHSPKYLLGGLRAWTLEVTIREYGKDIIKEFTQQPVTKNTTKASQVIRDFLRFINNQCRSIRSRQKLNRNRQEEQ